MIWQAIIELLRLALAAAMGLMAVVHLRVAVDLFRYGPAEIAHRRNPQNWRDEMVGCRVEKGGAVRFKTKRRYIG